MANISVNTTSTNFGLLPADLSQFGTWLGQYLPANQTIYQDQSNVLSGFLSLSNAVNAYVAANGVSSFNFTGPTDLQVTEGPYSLKFHGFFSIAFSEVTTVSMTNTATGETATESGNLVYAGYPLLGAIESQSTLTTITDSIPNPVTSSGNVGGAVALDNVIWNGTTWNGNVTGYSETVTDAARNKLYQTSVTENPASISFALNTSSTPGFVSLSVPVVTGVAVNVSDAAATTTTDSVAVSGFSYSASTVSAPQAIPTAIAGSDTVTISGAGSLNIVGQLVNSSNTITTMTLTDTAANVVGNLDFLQTLVALGKVASITLTDPGSPVLTITPGQQSADAQALQAISSPHSVVVTTVTDPGVLGGLSAAQQLEMVYVAYFNRSADGAGDTFWVGQNIQAQASGQRAGAALSNIANSFTPQPETIALYPFLGTPNLNLNTPAAQAGLTAFVGSVYGNLFGHAADQAGQNYWVGQITSGAVGLGAAALAIANGATGSDTIEVYNKITVATDFTTRTTGAGLGEASPLPASFITAAGNVLKGVDGIALNDASVTAGESATTSFISGFVTSTQTASLAADPNVITVSGSDQLIDPGTGNHTIQFLAGTSGDGLVLHAGSMDQVSGFNPGADVLDVRSMLSAANIDLNGDVAALGNYLTVANQGSDALVSFDPAGHGAGSAVALLQGLGGTGLDTLIAQGAIRTV
jgi:hypothetical protein